MVNPLAEQTPEGRSAGQSLSPPGRLWAFPGIEVIALGLIVVAASWLAWQGRFIHDDAFISFRYARHLAAGEGLVWNPGERVEGYTNFLWVLIMTIPHLLGIDVVVFSQAVGVGLFAATLILTWRLVEDQGGSRISALLTVLLLGCNYTFFRWAAGGMETALQAALGVACVWMTIRGLRARGWTARQLVAVSLLAALAVLTRLDSILILAFPLGVVALRLLVGWGDGRSKVRMLVALLTPFALLVGGWMAWKLSFYGDLLPNTYYVKVASYTRRRWGLDYLWLFLRQYLLIPFPLLGLAGLPRLLRNRDLPRFILVGIIAMWAGYLVQIGGDFLEFRLLAPILPFIFTLIVWLCDELIGTRAGRLALTGLVVLGSVYHALTFLPPAPTGGVESIRELEIHLEPDQGWDDIGRALAAVFPGPTQVTIAANPVGAIAYYSNLDTVDMLGLNDHWIAHNGIIVPIPGHQRRATLAYLLECDVNLVFGVPWVVSSDDQLSDLDLGPEVAESFMGGGSVDVPVPAGTSIVRIPLGTDRDVLAWYLTSSPEVDLAIVRLGWCTYPLRGSQEVPVALRPVGLARTNSEVAGGWRRDLHWSAGRTVLDGRGT
jgi:arabinofuranosyltransferase